MEQSKNIQMNKMFSELSELLCKIYGNKLQAVILYGSAARGTQTEESDVDIMVLVDGNSAELKEYDDRLSDVSTNMALKYLKVFSILDVSCQEYIAWNHISPFYKNVAKEGIFLYRSEAFCKAEENRQAWEICEKEENIRQKILESIKDIQSEKGREAHAFFRELEEKYVE